MIFIKSDKIETVGYLYRIGTVNNYFLTKDKEIGVSDYRHELIRREDHEKSLEKQKERLFDLLTNHRETFIQYFDLNENGRKLLRDFTEQYKRIFSKGITEKEMKETLEEMKQKLED